MYMHVSKHLNVSFMAENRAVFHNVAQRALAPEQASEEEEICCWKAGLTTLKIGGGRGWGAIRDLCLVDEVKKPSCRA